MLDGDNDAGGAFDDIDLPQTNGTAAAVKEPSAGVARPRGESVDLAADSSLIVSISDALTQQEKVKFTVQTKTTLPGFKKQEFSVVRLHEEFCWLNDRFVENKDYAGIIIPPPPPRPNFDASREKLQKLGEMSDGTLTRDEFEKMKKELEDEYLATFKKTVAMHEVYIQRLAAHQTLRKDFNFQTFLEFDQDLCIRGPTMRDKMRGMFSMVTKSVDEVLLAGQKDPDEYFETQKAFLLDYYNRIRTSTSDADRMTRSHKSTADAHINVASRLKLVATVDEGQPRELFYNLSTCLEKLRKVEGRIAADEDLKLSDTLRYYQHDSHSAKDLLYRRTRSLADEETTSKNVDKARAKGKEVDAAVAAADGAHKCAQNIQEVGKTELNNFKQRRITHFRKNLRDLADFEIKHAKSQVEILNEAIEKINSGEVST